MEEFSDKLPQQDHNHFQATLQECKLATRFILQTAIDSADTSSCVLTMGIVTRRELWLHYSSFPKEVQKTIEALPFNNSHLFSQKTVDSLHSLKDSRVTLQSLGICTPSPKRKCYRLPPSQRFRIPHFYHH